MNFNIHSTSKCDNNNDTRLPLKHKECLICTTTTNEDSNTVSGSRFPHWRSFPLFTSWRFIFFVFLFTLVCFRVLWHRNIYSSF